MTMKTVQSNLLTDVDRARVQDALSKLQRSDDLPEEVREPLFCFLRLVADGRSATVLEDESDLTTTEAAKVLCVSRPYLTRLLDEGHIPFHRTGRDRRIACADVLAFKQQRDVLKRRRAEAASTYDARRRERVAAIAGVSAEDAAELGF